VINIEFKPINKLTVYTDDEDMVMISFETEQGVPENGEIVINTGTHTV